ncbi:hypothetical protein [Sphingobium sp.]|uniref:hypothetical protein n=1 Tax=Sphingobium sp. TaxID=1912891 RepID=UPI003BB7C0D6
MSGDHFRVVYDGPAVEDGEMDVSQLASSLLALGKLIENADAIRTGEAGRVKVRVKSDVRRGSFDVGIAVHWIDGLKDAALAWALTPEGAGTLAILGLLGFNVKDTAIIGGKGVIQVVRWLHGRRVARQIILENGNTTLIVEDGEQLDVNTTVARLVDDPSIRQPLEKFTEPLRDDGLEEIRFENQLGVAAERIISIEAPAFVAASGAEPSSSSTFRATYQIKRLFFDRGRKWRLSNGAQTIQAEIEDEDFWARVDASDVSFAKEDYLVCMVRMDQWLSPSGLRTEYVIVRVEQHLPAPKQVALPGM